MKFVWVFLYIIYIALGGLFLPAMALYVSELSGLLFPEAWNAAINKSEFLKGSSLAISYLFFSMFYGLVLSEFSPSQKKWVLYIAVLPVAVVSLMVFDAHPILFVALLLAMLLELGLDFLEPKNFNFAINNITA
jgi:hypothetical protein